MIIFWIWNNVEIYYSRKFLGEYYFFSGKISDYLWPNTEGTLKPDVFIVTTTF